MYKSVQFGDYFDGDYYGAESSYSTTDYFPGRSRYRVCNPGYRIKDSEDYYIKITCSEEGKWQPEPPVCEPDPNRVCAPAIPFFQSIPSTLTSYNTHTLEEGTRIKYRCSFSYEFAGYSYNAEAMYRYCQADGSWAPQVPSCVSKPVCLPMRVRLGVLSITYTVSWNSTIFVVDPATMSGGAKNDGGSGGNMGELYPLGYFVAPARPTATRDGRAASQQRAAASSSAYVSDDGEVWDDSDVAEMTIGSATTTQSPDDLPLETQAYITCKSGFVFYPTSYTLCSRALASSAASGDGVTWDGTWSEDIMCIPMSNVTDARFDTGGTFVDVLFSYPTMQPVPTYTGSDGVSVRDTGGSFRTCTYLLANTTLDMLGDTETAGCIWRTPSVLRIRLGYGFSLRPASTITLQGSVIKPAVSATSSAFYNKIDDAFVLYMPQVSVSVHAPAVLPKLFVDLSAPSTIGNCSPLTLLVRSIIGHAGMMPSMAFELVSNGSNSAAISAFKIVLNRMAPTNINTPFSALTSPAPTFSISFNATELDTFFHVDTTATFSVRATNWLGSEFTATVNITRLSTDGPLISFPFGRSNTFAAADAITVTPRVTLSSCSVASGLQLISYSWSSLANETLPALFAATVTTLNQSTLVIPPFTLPSGASYRFRFCVTAGVPDLISTFVTVCERIKLTVKSMPLVVRLSLHPFAQQRFLPTRNSILAVSTVSSPSVRVFESSFTYVYEPNPSSELDSNILPQYVTSASDAATSRQRQHQKIATAESGRPRDSTGYAGVLQFPNEKLTLYADGSSDPDLETTNPNTLLYGWSCFRRYHSPSFVNTFVHLNATLRSKLTSTDLATNSSLSQLQLTANLTVLQNTFASCFAAGSVGANLLKTTQSILTLPPEVMATLVETEAERASSVGQQPDARVSIYFAASTYSSSDSTRVSTAVLGGTFKRGYGYYVNAVAVPHPQYATGVFSSSDNLQLSAHVAAKDSRYAVLWTCESGQLNLTWPYVTIGKRSLTTLVINATALSPDTTYTFRVHIFAADSAYPQSRPSDAALTAANSKRIPGAILPGALESAIVTIVTAPKATSGRCQVDSSIPVSQTEYYVRCYGFTTAETVLPLKYRWYLSMPQSTDSTVLSATGLDPVAVSRQPKMLLQVTHADPTASFPFYPNAAQILVEVVDATGVCTWTTFTLPAASADTVDSTGTEEQQAAALRTLKQERLQTLLAKTRVAVASQRAPDIIQSFLLLTASASELGARVQFAIAVTLLYEILDGKLDEFLASFEHIGSLIPFYTGTTTQVSESNAFVQPEQPTMSRASTNANYGS